MRSEKRPNQEEQEGSCLMVTRRKGGEEKKSQGSSKACHFYHREDHLKNDCKYRQEWSRKKRQVVEADITSGANVEVLMAFYVEDNTSQDKN